MRLARYRTGVQAAVAASAGPYGYTLTIWTSGAVLAHARGIPTTLEALLFMLGAVVAFAAVGVFAHGSLARELVPSRGAVYVWQSLHALSIAAAIGTSAVVAHFLERSAAWPIGGFLATALYLLGAGAQMALGGRMG